ncbi:MAG: AbrB/MazE/SpoVT family DNA-binding domain-containing protein [Candidatus Bathyarchaeia archaeon]
MTEKIGKKIIGCRRVVRSGESARVVIPSEIADELELEDGDTLVFIFIDGLIILKNLRALLPEKLEDEAVFLTLKLINDIVEIERRIQKLVEETIRGKIEEIKYKEEVERLKKEAKEKYEILKKVKDEAKKILPARELTFATLDNLDKIFTAISIEREREKEENLLALLEELGKFKEDVEGIKENLKLLEQTFMKGKIGKEQYEAWKEKYLGSLALAEDRLMRIKSILSN